jgi:hypothetical protein
MQPNRRWAISGVAAPKPPGPPSSYLPDLICPTHQQQKGRRTKVCRWGWLKRNCAGIFCYALTTEKYAPFSFSILTQHKRACSYPSGTKNATTNALTGTTFVLVCNVWPQYMNLWRHLLMATFFWKEHAIFIHKQKPVLTSRILRLVWYSCPMMIQVRTNLVIFTYGSDIMRRHASEPPKHSDVWTSLTCLNCSSSRFSNRNVRTTRN